MQDIFLLCLGLGALVLLVQIALDLLGFAHLPTDIAGDGLDLLSVRTVAAGSTLFGAVGLWLTASGAPALLAAPVALTAGLLAAVGTAALSRQFMRLESSGSLHVENAIGQAGTVYLPIPARREGLGKVQLTLQKRTVELAALADEAHTLPTGTTVIIVGIVDGDTVEVTPTPIIEGIDV
jgi:hypothetical protein